MTKTWTLTPTHTLTLAPPNKRGECSKCHSEKDIWLRADTDYEIQWFCWSCSMDVVYKLETSAYPVKNKSQIIKELQEVLHKNSQDEKAPELIRNFDYGW